MAFVLLLLVVRVKTKAARNAVKVQGSGKGTPAAEERDAAAMQDARVDVCFDEGRTCPFDGTSRASKAGMPMTALIAPLDSAGPVTGRDAESGGGATEHVQAPSEDLPQTGRPFTNEDAHGSTILVHPKTRAVVLAFFSGSEGNAGVQIAVTVLQYEGDEKGYAKQWRKPAVVSLDPDRSNQNPVLFWHPTEEAVMLVHTSQAAGLGQGTAEVRWLRALDDGCTRWTKPVALIPGTGRNAGAFVRNAFMSSADGNQVYMPFYYTPHGYGAFDSHRSTLRRIAWERLRWSSDADEPTKPSADDWEEAVVTEAGEFLAQPTMVRLPYDSLPAEASRDHNTDGSHEPLVMFFRDRLQSRIYASFSPDDGHTWHRLPWHSPKDDTDVPQETMGDQDAMDARYKLPKLASPTRVPQNNSGICVLRLFQWSTKWLTEKLGVPGRTCMMLIFNNLSGEGARFPLSVALSCDGGASFPYVRDLESGVVRDYTPGEFSYPSAAQDPVSGTIHIAYTWRRETIKHVAVNVAWLAGAPPGSSAGALQGGS